MKFREILQQYWGHDDFRGIQRDIIESISQGRDTLGLMPTGGGKSITFQVPALSMPGTCLVVTPLIALMKDQVARLRQLGILANAIYTGMTHEEILVILDNCIYGNYKFLYVSPERLGSELFQAKLRQMHISFITVDEAHCISQWGYDFRPAYTKIADIRSIVPEAPVLALTATATPEVIRDIQSQLRFREENVIQMSFARANLIYIVRRCGDSPIDEIDELLNVIPGPSIIYTRSRRKTEEIATWLTKRGHAATYYHAGLNTFTRNERQAAFQQGDVRIMVATNAFGMGIDKSDVRSVIHVDIPDSPEAYFQEAGRAGRDGRRAYAVLLVDARSRATLHKRIDETYPPLEYVRSVYEDMCCFLELSFDDGSGFVREFDLNLFCINFHHYATRAYNALLLLSRAGYIEWLDPEDSRSRVMFTITREQLYGLPLTKTEDRIVYYLLRNYTGLFSEYSYIEESLIAHVLDLTQDEVNETLIALGRAHIISFIPRKFIPRIVFTQRRVDLDEIILPPSISDDRRKQMESRIETMMQYVETDECRSRFLLRYFGEKDTAECGLCDNCLGEDFAFHLDADEKAKAVGERAGAYFSGLSDEQFQTLRERIMETLRTQGPTAITELDMPDVPNRLLGLALHLMLLEEEIEYIGNKPIITIPQHNT